MTKSLASASTKPSLSDLYVTAMKVIAIIQQIGDNPPSRAVDDRCNDWEEKLTSRASDVRAVEASRIVDQAVVASSLVMMEDVRTQMSAPPEPITVDWLDAECGHAQAALEDAYHSATGTHTSYALRLMGLHAKLPAGLLPILPSTHQQVARRMAASLASAMKGSPSTRSTAKRSHTPARAPAHPKRPSTKKTAKKAPTKRSR